MQATTPDPDSCRCADEKLRLLVVDDDPHTRMLLCEALELRGADVRASASAHDAACTFATWRPRALISDIAMPVEDGYELIRRVRAAEAEGPRTPAIACTGHAGPADRARARAAGFDALVAKPVDIGLLIDTIGHLTGVRGFGRGGSRAAPDRDASSPGVTGSANRSRSAPDS